MPGDRPPLRPGESVGTFSGRGTLSGVALSLEKEAEREGLSVADQIALQDAGTRKWMAEWIIATFIGGNGLTLAALGVLVWLDQSNIEHKLITPGDRIVSHQVIMALLAATTVQVGTIAAIIARYLFPGRARD